MKRNPYLYSALLVITVAAGLASRRFPAYLPEFVHLYAGDVLWALMVFVVLCIAFPGRSTKTLAIASLLFSFCIEISQFYHAPWIDGLRSYKLGGLILGFGFQWSDMVCYTLGVAFGIAFDRLFFHKF